MDSKPKRVFAPKVPQRRKQPSSTPDLRSCIVPKEPQKIIEEVKFRGKMQNQQRIEAATSANASGPFSLGPSSHEQKNFSFKASRMLSSPIIESDTSAVEDIVVALGDGEDVPRSIINLDQGSLLVQETFTTNACIYQIPLKTQIEEDEQVGYIQIRKSGKSELVFRGQVFDMSAYPVSFWKSVHAIDPSVNDSFYLLDIDSHVICSPNLAAEEIN